MFPDVDTAYLQRLVDTAKRYFPKLNTFDHQYLSAQANLKKMKMAWFDVFTFTYLYSPNNSTTLANPSLLNGYQLGVVFSVGQLFRTGPQIRQAREDAIVIQSLKAEFLQNLEMEVKNRYFVWIQNKVVVRVQTHAALDAENMMKEAKYRFEKGEVPFETYSNALITFTQVQQRILDAEGQILIAKARIEELTVKKLEEIK